MRRSRPQRRGASPTTVVMLADDRARRRGAVPCASLRAGRGRDDTADRVAPRRLVNDDRVRLQVGVATDKAQRALNEDSVWTQDGVFLVADGMGGHDRGEVASQTAIGVLRRLADGAPTLDDARAAVRDAHAAVRSLPKGTGRRPGTTVTGVVLTEHDDAPVLAGPQRGGLPHLSHGRAPCWSRSRMTTRRSRSSSRPVLCRPRTPAGTHDACRHARARRRSPAGRPGRLAPAGEPGGPHARVLGRADRRR